MKSLLENRIALTLVVILLLLAAGSGGALWYMKTKGAGGDLAEIYQKGKLIKTVPLDTVTAPYTIRIDGKDGMYNLIEVRQGQIGMIEASCPDDLCVNMGFISSAGIPITCLPNKVVIKIIHRQGDEEMVPDGVAY